MRFVRRRAKADGYAWITTLGGVLLLGVCLLLLTAGPAKATDIVRNPNTIHCPSAPKGWLIEVGASGAGLGREVKNPMTDPTLQGEDIVLVTCDYFAKSGRLRHVLVNVAYALPFDVNPIYDFYYGCGSRGTPWNDQDRVYRVTSPDQWAIATFYDENRDVNSNEVSGFEAITRGLLQNTAGYAHPCNLRSAPSDVPSNFTYTFASDAGNGVGSFVVTGVAPQTGSVPIASVTHERFALNVGGRHLVIVVQGGVRFFPATSHQRDKLILTVVVAKSDEPSCSSGAKGTFTLTNTSLEVGVCGRVFSAANATGHMVFL